MQTNFENVDSFVDPSTCTNESKVCNVSVQPLWTEEEMASEQRRDQNIGPVVKWLEDQEDFQWSNFSKYGSETKQLLFERERLGGYKHVNHVECVKVHLKVPREVCIYIFMISR